MMDPFFTLTTSSLFVITEAIAVVVMGLWTICIKFDHCRKLDGLVYFSDEVILEKTSKPVFIVFVIYP
jgi:hypothetical protein